MKLQSRKTHTKNRIILGCLVLVLLVGFMGFSYAKKTWPVNLWTSTPTSDSSSIKTKEMNDQQSVDDKASIEDRSPDVDVSQTTNNVPVSPTTTIEVSDLSQSNGAINYTAKISGASTGGTCNANFSNDIARPVSRTTSASNGACGPVSIPETEFSTIGQWKLTLRYYTNDTQAVITKDIEVK